MSKDPHSDTSNPVVKYFRDFKVLGQTRREYWGIQVINFLDNTIFFSVFTIAVILLSEDFGFSDEKAGYVLTLYGATTTICLFFSGVFTDWLGIRKSLYVAMAGQLITRSTVVLVAFWPDIPHRGWIVTGAFFLMAPFVAMVQTTFQAANKRFTTTKSRGAGFNLWYLFMNIGAAAGGFLIDIIRRAMELPNAHIFTVGIFSAAACMFVAFLMIQREEQLYAPGEQPTETTKPKRKSPFQIAWAVMSESVFWRFLALASPTGRRAGRLPVLALVVA